MCIVSFVFAACNNNNPENDDSGTTDTAVNTGNDEDDFVEKQTWNSTVSIIWDGASVTVSGLVDGVVETSNSNGYLVITSTSKHIEYAVSGSGTGQLKIYSDYKFKLSLNELTLSCPDGPAINNQCGKSCYLVLSGTNTLSDGTTYTDSTEDQKAALFSEGQLLVSGNGALIVTGNYKHAMASDDYIRLRGGDISLTAKVSDGLHANDGIIIDDGTLTVSAAGDAIQCDTSSIVIAGGVITVTAAGDKGILACTDIIISGGRISVNSVDKGIKAGGNLTVSDGDITVVCSGGSSSSRFPGPGGGGMQPGGGNDSSGPEAIESKAKITISGGRVYAQSSDDAINSGSDMTISGGYVCAYSTGNDGLDANGNLYISGGVVYAIGTSSPEVAVDANSEGGYKLYLSGGTVIAIGGLESGSTLSQSCYTASSWSSNTWYALYSGNDLTLAFRTPASGGSGLVVSTASAPSLTAGVTATGGTSLFNGMALLAPSVSGGSSVSLSSYSGGNQGGDPGRRR